jgi:hypothetical protein
MTAAKPGSRLLKTSAADRHASEASGSDAVA